jgi:hypothetical protein
MLTCSPNSPVKSRIRSRICNAAHSLWRRVKFRRRTLVCSLSGEEAADRVRTRYAPTSAAGDAILMPLKSPVAVTDHVIDYEIGRVAVLTSETVSTGDQEKLPVTVKSPERGTPKRRHHRGCRALRRFRFRLEEECPSCSLAPWLGLGSFGGHAQAPLLLSAGRERNRMRGALSMPVRGSKSNLV